MSASTRSIPYGVPVVDEHTRNVEYLRARDDLTPRAAEAEIQDICESCSGNGLKYSDDKYPTPVHVSACPDCFGGEVEEYDGFTFPVSTGIRRVNCHGPCGEAIGFADVLGDLRYCSLDCEQADREPDDR